MKRKAQQQRGRKINVERDAKKHGIGNENQRSLESGSEANGNLLQTTHSILGLLVGAGIDQQSHTIRVTISSGTHQRRQSDLRVGLVATFIRPHSKT